MRAMPGARSEQEAVHHLGQLAQVPALLGDVVTWNQVRVEVTRVAGRGVAEALLTRMTSAAS